MMVCEAATLFLFIRKQQTTDPTQEWPIAADHCAKLLPENLTGSWPRALAMAYRSQRTRVSCSHQNLLSAHNVEILRLGQKAWARQSPETEEVQHALGRRAALVLNKGKKP